MAWCVGVCEDKLSGIALTRVVARGKVRWYLTVLPLRLVFPDPMLELPYTSASSNRINSNGLIPFRHCFINAPSRMNRRSLFKLSDISPTLELPLEWFEPVLLRVLRLVP